MSRFRDRRAHTSNGDRWSLSRLGAKGIDVHKPQDYCRTEYSKWSDAGLRRIIAFLRLLEPAPDIVLFTEGAIPVNGHPVATFSVTWTYNGVTVQ